MKLVIQDVCRHLVRTEEAAKAKLFTRNQCRTQMLRGIATGSSPVCLVLSRVHNYKRGEVGVQSPDKGHNVETWFKCTYVQVFLVPIYVHMSAGLLASIMHSEPHPTPNTYPPPPQSTIPY